MKNPPIFSHDELKVLADAITQYCENCEPTDEGPGVPEAAISAQEKLDTYMSTFYTHEVEMTMRLWIETDPGCPIPIKPDGDGWRMTGSSAIADPGHRQTLHVRFFWCWERYVPMKIEIPAP